MATQRPLTCIATEDRCSAWADEREDRRRRARAFEARQLVDVIETQIIPRLLMVSQAAPEVAGQPVVAAIDASQIEELARLAVHHDADVVMAFVTGVRGQGFSIDQVLLELLSPAARLIGKLWEADRVTFIDVTVALTRLQQTVRMLRPTDTDPPEEASPGAARVLLLPTPGEQHTFGLIVVADMLRAAGLVVSGGYEISGTERRRLLATYPFVLVGFSLSSDTLLPSLEQAIQGVRRSPLNRKTCVLVGGRLFHDNPDAVKRVGADGVALDGRHAVEMAKSLAQSFRH